jgi:hypothetical protein
MFRVSEEQIHGNRFFTRMVVQVKRKGRSVHVEPVAGFNTERLRKVVQASLALQQHTDSDQGTLGGPANTRPHAKLQLARHAPCIVMARACMNDHDSIRMSGGHTLPSTHLQELCSSLCQ